MVVVIVFVLCCTMAGKLRQVTFIFQIAIERIRREARLQGKASFYNNGAFNNETSSNMQCIYASARGG